ncbi:MAG: transposase [Chloroflexota bacterium]
MASNLPPLKRRSIRLPHYDYSQQGVYFVTICTQQREMHFDDSTIKQIAETCWLEIPLHFPGVGLDEWVIMPNHIHGVLILPETPPTEKRISINRFAEISPRAKTLSVVIRTYKGAVTSGCRRTKNLEFAWQRNYYERVVRTEKELNQIRHYILENPEDWLKDEENPKRLL